jgi:hypothetical protein
MLALDGARCDFRRDLIGDTIELPSDRVGNHLNRFGKPDVPQRSVLDTTLELLRREPGTDLSLEWQATHTRMHDNLEDIASLLTSNTQRNAVSAAVPVAAIFGKASAEVPWAPRIGYTFDRVHQTGKGIPVNSDFSATHVPDQMSVNQTFTIDVERVIYRAGYRFGRSHQDNRQPGQERADLINLTNAVTAGMSLSNLNLAGDVSFDRASNLELSTVDRTRRIALMGDWRITPRVGVSSNASISWFGDDRRTSASRSTDFTVEGYWQIVFRRSPATRPSMRAFVRYARQSSLLQNLVFGVPSSLRTGWTVNSGINMSVF